MPPRFQDKQPLKTLAKASKSCAKEVSPITASRSGTQLTTQSLAYGQCIGKQYQDVRKDMCAPEFAQFKNCVQVSFIWCLLS